jgi:hypothetical protein
VLDTTQRCNRKEAVMGRAHFSIGSWVVWAERGLLRLAMIALAVFLIIGGLAMGVTMVMLPLGVIVGLVGVGLLVWGLLGDLPVD